MKSYKTCESVRIGHPDKLCDFIADYISTVASKLIRTAVWLARLWRHTERLLFQVRSHVNSARISTARLKRHCNFVVTARIISECLSTATARVKTLQAVYPVRSKKETGTRTSIPHSEPEIKVRCTVMLQTKPRKCFPCHWCLHISI